MPTQCLRPLTVSLVLLMGGSFAAANAPADTHPVRGCIGLAALWGDRLIFESAGDLWTARIPSDPSQPIEAARLTSGAGVERWPVISPDGARVAFVGEYDGNPEIYVMPINGATPSRLTFHPGRDSPLAWSSDGQRVLFRSQRASPLRRWELFSVPVDGGAAERLPIGECSLISVDQGSGRMAFTRWSNESWNWRGYRGGTAPDIWIASADFQSMAPLTSTDANELFPCFAAERVVYVSDESGHSQILSDRPEGGDRRVLLDDASPGAFDVRRLAADAKPGGTRVVFSRGCDLGVLDAVDGSMRMLDIQLVGDRLDERIRRVDPMAALSAISLSPDGSMAALETRGEILLVPTKDPTPGSPQRWRQIPQRSDARDSGLAWATSSSIGYLSDADGKPHLVLQSLSESDPEVERSVSLAVNEWVFPPQLSADESMAVYGDKSDRLHLLDLPSGRDRVIATSDAGEIIDYRFSPDGAFIAFTMPRRTGISQVMIYSIADGTTSSVGDGISLDLEPRWDPAGKYLYFLSKRHIDPLLDPFDFNFVNLGPTVVCAVSLEKKTPPPIRAIAAAAGVDLEKWAKGGEGTTEKGADEGAKSDESPGAKSAPVAGDKSEPKPVPVKIDATGLAQRVVILPIDSGNLESLEAIPGGVLYVRRKAQTLNEEIWPPPPIGVPGGTLHRATLADDEDKPLIDAKLTAYAVSRNGSMVLAATEGGLLTVPLDDASSKGEPLSLKGVTVAVDVRREWAQIFDDAWRLQRDFFWRDDFGGVDWDAVKLKYQALVLRVGSRAELNELIGQMMGELGTSHLYIGGGDDFGTPKKMSVGLLGIDTERRGDSIVISRVLPDRSALEGPESPLAAPHLGIESGTVLVAINGIVLDPALDYQEQLVGRGGQPVQITVADDAAGTNRRTLEVTALEDETALRYLDWVESNRQRVVERSGGRLGYMHLPDMDAEGLTTFVRWYFPQLDREGLVIDARDNGGGFVSQMIIERLARKPYAWTLPRHGSIEAYPQRVMDGPIAVIVDQHAGSDGDIFPETFRLRGLGRIVGTRTWGGVVGIRQDKPFVDGGVASQPEFAWWEPIRGFSLENTGVTPDVIVPLTPQDRVANLDPQLDRTVDLLLEDLRSRSPTPKPSRPGSAGP